MQAHSRENGFTLVEMMVALVVVGIIGISMARIFRAQHVVQVRQNIGVEHTMNARAAVDMMARELTNAGYDPRDTGGAGFEIMEPADVKWSADLNGDGDAADFGEGSDEVVRYFFDADLGAIVREVNGLQAMVSDNITSLTISYLDKDLVPTGDGGSVEQVNIAVEYDTPEGVMTGRLQTQVAIRNQIYSAKMCAANPTVFVEGNLEISGNPSLLGCSKSVHANGDLKIGGNVIASGTVTATGAIDLGGSVQNEDGEAVEAQSGAASASVPKYENPTSSHCDDADYLLKNTGMIERVSDGTSHDASSSEKFGWKRSGTSPTIWEYAGDGTNSGTFCVEGSAKMSGNPGQGAATPVSMTIIAKGSIEVSGNPFLTADDPNGFLFLAGGDLKINGNPMGSKTNFTGVVYGYSQCEVSGAPKLASQLICRNMPTPGHAVDLVSENKISGDLLITSNCGSC